MAKLLDILTGLSFLILIPFNLLGGVVSLVWLGIGGEWAVIAYGFIYALFGTWVLVIPLMLGAAMAALTIKCMEKGLKIFTFLFGFVSASASYVVIFASSLLVFQFLLNHLNDMEYLLPFLVWAHGAVIAPWQYMASRSDNHYAALTVFFTQTGFLLFIICYWFGFSFEQCATVFGGTLFLGIVFQFLLIQEEQLLHPPEAQES